MRSTSSPLPGQTFGWRNDTRFGVIDAEACLNRTVEFAEMFDAVSEPPRGQGRGERRAMRLEVFHAADGDCLLLSSGDGHHVLVDGGRAGTFADNTQPRLQELKLAGRRSTWCS